MVALGTISVLHWTSTWRPALMRKCPAYSEEWECRDFVNTLTRKTVPRELCCVCFRVERDYPGKFYCTLEARAFSLLKANYRSNKSWYKMLGKQSFSDQTSNYIKYLSKVSRSALLV